MFLAVVFICGMNHPIAVDGCSFSVPNKLTLTEEECRQAITDFVYSVQLPEGAYVTDLQCVQMKGREL